MEKGRSNTTGLSEALNVKKDVENQVASFLIAYIRRAAPGKTPNEYRVFVEDKRISVLFDIWFKKLCDRNISISTFDELYNGHPETVLGHLARIESKSFEAFLGEFLVAFNARYSRAKTTIPIRRVRARTTAKVKAVITKR